jgi:hypothetical protein
VSILVARRAGYATAAVLIARRACHRRGVKASLQTQDLDPFVDQAMIDKESDRRSWQG